MLMSCLFFLSFLMMFGKWIWRIEMDISAWGLVIVYWILRLRIRDGDLGLRLGILIGIED